MFIRATNIHLTPSNAENIVIRINISLRSHLLLFDGQWSFNLHTHFLHVLPILLGQPRLLLCYELFDHPCQECFRLSFHACPSELLNTDLVYAHPTLLFSAWTVYFGEHP